MDTQRQRPDDDAARPPSATRATAGRSDGSARLLAVDLARAAALMGMVLVNVGPLEGTGPAAWLISAAHGRASILFVLLAGLGVGLLLGSGRSRGTASLLARGAVLLVGGLALQLLDHEVNVILPMYAALFLVALAVARVPDRVLLGMAVAGVVLGPLIWTLAQIGGDFALTAPTLADSPADVLAAVVLTGPYPLVTWTAPFLLGIWLGRQDLADVRMQRRLLLVGAALTLVPLLLAAGLAALGVVADDRLEPSRIAIATAHSQMPLWLLTATGSALVVLAAALLLAPRLARSRLAAALATLGRASLTAYVAHLFVIALLVRPGPTTAAGGVGISAAFAVGALIVTNLWARRFPRGPFEEVLRAPERLLGRRSRPEHPPAAESEAR